MRWSPLVNVLLIVPAIAGAQAGALQRARDAGTQLQQATRARQAVADAQYAEGDDAVPPAAPQAQGEAPEGDVERGEAVAADPAARGVDASETYTVQRGDTLWDLSGKFMSDPWAWPKVWSYNPSIPNPHFIYPGQVLRFAPGTGGVPGRLEAVAEDDGYAAPRELGDLTRADRNGPALDDGDEVAVAGPYKIGYVAPKGIYARHDTFVTQHELEESGVLSAAFDEKSMLSLLDRAYVKFKAPAAVKVGERYLVYKTVRLVTHPVTKAPFGYQAVVLGTARVVAVDDRAATIELVQVFEPIERGALLGPSAGKLLRQITRRPNAKALQGHILAAQERVLTELGEHHVVFLDKGLADGVQEGNVFTVVRSGDLEKAGTNSPVHDPSLPDESVGSLLVVDVQETSSAALVVKSTRELFIGDAVEMRVAPAAAPTQISVR